MYCLPSDVGRHRAQQESNLATATTSEERDAARAEHSQWRSDVAQLLWRHSCLQWLSFVVRGK